MVHSEMEVGMLASARRSSRQTSGVGVKKEKSLVGENSLGVKYRLTCSCIIYSDDNGGGASGPLGVGPATSVPDEAKVVGNRILSPNISWKHGNEGCDPTIEG